MSTPLTNEEFSFIADLLKKRSGLSLTPDKGYLLETRLNPIARSNGMAGIKELIAKLRGNPTLPIAYEVVQSMTTNESMFFRDQRPFDQLINVILPELKEQGRTKLRIWSAACSTGQEPYSIAMALKEASFKYPLLTYEIHATDLSEKVVERARLGIYSQFEIQRDLPINLLMKYFTQLGNNNWEIGDRIKSMVRFSTGNLLLPFNNLGKFDVIFCRNVMLYFDEKTKGDVMNRLAPMMNPPGYLYLGGAETAQGLTTRFKTMAAHRGLFMLS